MSSCRATNAKPFWTDNRSIFDLLQEAKPEVDDSKLRAWMASEQTKNAEHPGRDPECDGCQMWGVCAWHAPPDEPGLAARSAKQAEAWRRAGYEPAGFFMPAADEPQDLQE